MGMFACQRDWEEKKGRGDRRGTACGMEGEKTWEGGGRSRGKAPKGKTGTFGEKLCKGNEWARQKMVKVWQLGAGPATRKRRG